MRDFGGVEENCGGRVEFGTNPPPYRATPFSRGTNISVCYQRTTRDSISFERTGGNNEAGND